jgi:hypothetical protein
MTGLTTKEISGLLGGGRCSERREEVLVVLISRRVQLALVALASVAAAAWLGGCPWGP